jgi:hypothetical protein
MDASAIFITSTPKTPDLEREISRDPTLSDRQKETLLEVYRSFRSGK